MSITEVVFIGKDNIIKLKLTEDGVPVDLSGVTRVTITVGATTVDSDTTPTAFDWTTSTLETGELHLTLGPSLTVPQAAAAATLVLYDAAHVNGKAWERSCSDNLLLIQVCA